MRLAYYCLTVKRKQKILALMVSEAPWQYYIKYEQFLYQLKHPFQQHIDFVRDYRMNLPTHIITQYAAVAFFYHDPLHHLYPAVYRYAKQIERLCHENEIHFINTPDSLSNTTKSVQLKLLHENGIPVAQSVAWKHAGDLHVFEEKQQAFFIRFDNGHDSQGQYVQGPFTSVAQWHKQFDESRFKPGKHLSNLTALAFIDTQSSDGLYRKYRSYATPTDAIKGFVCQSDHWYIHGNNAHKTEQAYQEQAQYIASPLCSVERALFMRVAQTLALDFCAIDYAYQPNGDIIIWEANPHPALSNNEPSRTRITHFLSNYYHRFLTP